MHNFIADSKLIHTGKEYKRSRTEEMFSPYQSCLFTPATGIFATLFEISGRNFGQLGRLVQGGIGAPGAAALRDGALLRAQHHIH
jgi:hypothetical protein